MQQIGSALGLGPRKERQRVRGNSHQRGRCEGALWRRTDRREVQRTLLAAKRYDLAHRQPGRRKGPLGHVALEVLELLGNLVDFKTGRLEPSHDYLQAKLKRCRAAIVAALKALRAHGFLERLRRFEATGCEGKGPQIKQASNAYRMSLPTRAARMLRGSPPLPDDEVQRLADFQGERDALEAAMSLEELGRFKVEDDALGRLLADLGRRVQERESAERSEYQG